MTHPPIRFFANDAGVRRIDEGFLACTLAKVEWTHEAHLATCLWLIAERPEIVAECDLPALIRRYNKSVGRVNDDRQGYHETITQVSVAAVRDHLAETGEVTLLGQVNALLKSERGRRDWPLRFYSRERLLSAAARRSWIAPDIASIAAWSRHTERALKRIGSQTDGVGIMGIFDSILGQVSEHVDVANMASKLGIDPAMAEKAIAALGQAHHAPILVKALKEEIGLPIHFHTHDTSGAAIATVLAAAEAGVDAVDAAMDAFSGNTSQPTLGSVVEALRNTDRDTGLDIKAIREISNYWEQVRAHYAAFESGLQAPASEVYLHEMPGGQFTNLKAQARSLGLEERWHEVAQTYADVNQMFGDIVKVTPSSKVVGDMALMMVSQSLTRAQVEDPAIDVAFPDSVIDMMMGNLGQPPGGWPQAIQAKILKGAKPMTDRPGKALPAVDLEAVRAQISAEMGAKTVDDEDLMGYLMYPKVVMDYMGRHKTYGPVRCLPSRTFFYGMAEGEEISAEIDPGKTLEIRLQTVGDTSDDGDVRVFFELNGQPRTIRVPNRKVAAQTAKRPKAEAGNAKHIGAPMPGVVASVGAVAGKPVHAGDLLLTIEAMKMETGIHADRDGVIKAVHVHAGAQIDAKDLLVELE